MNKYGFSLIELITVLIIMTIIAAFLVPHATNFLNRSKSNAVSSQLLQAIHLARTESFATHQKIVLCGSENSKSCSSNWNEGYIIFNEEKIIYTFNHIAHDGFLYWRAFPKNRKDLEFLPGGELNSENGTFWYCLPHDRNPLFAIAISQSARARMIYPNAEGDVLMDAGEKLQC